jgi:hypothetical protein
MHILDALTEMKKKESSMDGRRVTNWIGVFVLTVVLGYIVIQTWAIPAYKARQAQQEDRSKYIVTRERMDRLAKMPEVWGRSGEYDGWGNRMTYSIQGNTVVFVSAGPDGQQGTSDDIIKEYTVPKKWRK